MLRTRCLQRGTLVLPLLRNNYISWQILKHNQFKILQNSMSARLYYIGRLYTLSLVIGMNSIPIHFWAMNLLIVFSKILLDVFCKEVMIILFINGSSQAPSEFSINKWIFYFCFVHKRNKLMIWDSDSLLTTNWHFSASSTESGPTPDPGRIQKGQQTLQGPQARHFLYLKTFRNSLSEDISSEGCGWHPPLLSIMHLVCSSLHIDNAEACQSKTI